MLTTRDIVFVVIFSAINFDWSTILIWKSFGASRHISGKLGLKWAIFKGITIYGRGGHLGHVTSIVSSDFHFLVPESFHTKFGSDRHSSF